MYHLRAVYHFFVIFQRAFKENRLKEIAPYINEITVKETKIPAGIPALSVDISYLLIKRLIFYMIQSISFALIHNIIFL